eukprot:SAG31_NODE_2283_length_6016_cov_17.773872_4_plen_196_part_00
MRPLAALGFNLVAAVALILVNKLVFKSLEPPFRFPIMLSTIHFAVTILALSVLKHGGLYQPRSARMSPKLWAVSLGKGLGTALSNLSLELNSVGTSQLAKLLVVPAIVIVQYLIYGEVVSRPKAVGRSALNHSCAVGTNLEFPTLRAGLSDALLRGGWLGNGGRYRDINGWASGCRYVGAASRVPQDIHLQADQE